MSDFAVALMKDGQFHTISERGFSARGSLYLPENSRKLSFVFSPDGRFIWVIRSARTTGKNRLHPLMLDGKVLDHDEQNLYENDWNLDEDGFHEIRSLHAFDSGCVLIVEACGEKNTVSEYRWTGDHSEHSRFHEAEAISKIREINGIYLGDESNPEPYPIEEHWGIEETPDMHDVVVKNIGGWKKKIEIKTISFTARYPRTIRLTLNVGRMVGDMSPLLRSYVSKGAAGVGGLVWIWDYLNEDGEPYPIPEPLIFNSPSPCEE